MAEGATATVRAGPDLNTAGNPAEIAMAYVQDEVKFNSFCLIRLLYKTTMLNGLCNPTLLSPVSIHSKIHDHRILHLAS